MRAHASPEAPTLLGAVTSDQHTVAGIPTPLAVAAGAVVLVLVILLVVTFDFDE